MSRLSSRIDPAAGMEKIRPLEELMEKLARMRAEKRAVVHTHGVFELLHIAAIRHLERAKKQGDLLVVTITPDASVPSVSGRALFNQALRAEAAASLQCVDLVAIAKTPLAADAISAIHPDVYVPWEEGPVSAEERARTRETEAAILQALGGRVVAGRPAPRSPSLIHHHSPALSPEAESFLGPFCSRHSAERVTDWLDKTRGLKVLFVGETIIDEYQYCETIGKSGKEPILAARYLSAEKFAGGVLATANQAAAFCDHVGMVTLLGTQESHEEFIREKLDPKIDASFLYMPGSRTILKRRMVEVYPFQKLFEVYFMEPTIPDSVLQALHARLRSLLPHYDAVVVTDYGHGMITPEIMELLCSQGRFLAINTQTNAANQGFNTISKYRRADYACLSEKELRLEARNRSKDPRLIMADSAERLRCKRMLITRGRVGSLCYHADEGFFEVPSFTNHIVDRIGAGDALLAVTSLLAALGAPMELLGFVGNAVGAQAVETVGNRSVVSRPGLQMQLESLLNFDHWLSTQ